MASKRVQVILDENERESFRRLAEERGQSLSSWLREAGRQRREEQSARPPLSDPEVLMAFFSTCDGGESGREPDWEEHRERIERSRVAGLEVVPRG